MKRNLKNSFFVLMGFFIIFTISSCNNIFILKKATQVSFNLNIQGLQAAQQKQSGALNNRAAGGDVSQVIISLYQVTDPASISENQQLDTSKLKLLESITPPVTSDGKVHSTFNEVTVGITAVIFVEIYETDPADASQNLAYKGNSSVFTVQEGENTVEIELKKIISTLEKLTNILTTTTGEPIYIAGNFDISDTLNITTPTTLIAVAPTTFTRTKDCTDALFTYNADFTLQGSSNARITINGNNIEAVAPAIKTQSNTTTANLTVTYCNFENNINTGTDGGAVFVDTTEEVYFSASNCNFTNNKVTGDKTLAGGAVAINAAKSISSFINCIFESNTAENNGGGALYISGSSTDNYSHTIANSTFRKNSTNLSSSNSGGAIYLSQGVLKLNTVTMEENKHYYNENEPSQYSSSDIFIFRNYTNVTLCGTIIINSLVDNFGSGTNNPVIKLENFSTESQIGVLCTAGTGASVDDGDPLITLNDAEKLSQEQIACFTSIVDSNGKQYTLNANGTITAKN
ncbi:MAG: hypothetical protein IKW26_06050 [Treponema sp.]|nr:hypothetical protein [Treponema sp.]